MSTTDVYYGTYEDLVADEMREEFHDGDLWYPQEQDNPAGRETD